jgi:hypothetical protein
MDEPDGRESHSYPSTPGHPRDAMGLTRSWAPSQYQVALTNPSRGHMVLQCVQQGGNAVCGHPMLGSCWMLKSGGITNPAGSRRRSGSDRQYVHGSPGCLDYTDVAMRLESLQQDLPTPVPASDPGLQRQLSQVSNYLFAAYRDVQRNMRTPMSPSDISALSRLLTSISDLLALEGISAALGRPISGQVLVETSYQLLDTANEYSILAQHFYSNEVRAVRVRRPSDAVESEIKAVSRKAVSLKAGVIEFLGKVADAFKGS